MSEMHRCLPIPKFKIQNAQTISIYVSLHLAISNLPDHQEIITAPDPMSLHYEGRFLADSNGLQVLQGLVNPE
jgi:hypothetical protein